MITSRSFAFALDSTWQQDSVLRPGSCYRHWSRMRNDWYRNYCLGNKEVHTKKERWRWWWRWTETWRSVKCVKTDLVLRKSFINPFTAKCGQRRNSTKISEFYFVKFLITNSTGHVKVQAERFHLNGYSIGFRPHSTKKGRVTLQNSITHSGSKRVNNSELKKVCLPKRFWNFGRSKTTAFSPWESPRD